MKRGSITVFLALILSVMTALVGTQLLSVKLAAGRAQIACALDIGLYSLFAQYDRELLEEFDLFFLDGSFGSGQLNLEKIYDILEEYTVPVLEQNFTELTLEGGGLTGYALASDDEGAAFFSQAVQAQKAAMTKEGIEFLAERILGQGDRVRQQEQAGNGQDLDSALEDYDRQIAQGETDGETSGNAADSEGFVPEVSVPLENPIETIRRIASMGVLELVLEQPQETSDRAVSGEELFSRRKKEQGMGFLLPSGEEEFHQELLFQEYLLDRCGTYVVPGRGGLAYQCEYILFGELSDRENLKAAAKRLLLIREGANLLHLYGDGAKRSQAAALASAVASAFLLPVAAPVLEAAILACWAFAESVLDVRCLFSGGTVALVKSAKDWRISLERLPYLLEELEHPADSQEGGMDYRDYLRVLFLMKGREEKVSRGMDVVELSVRSCEGRENFRMDCCIAAVEAAVDVLAGGVKSYTAVHSYTY